VEHEAAEQMKKALHREKELGELKVRFVSMASHEFRTPLATIQTSSEILKHYSDRLSLEEREDAINDIQKSVARIQAMMENFLSFGRMATHGMVCDPRPVAVQRLLDEATQEIAAADGHQHLIATEFSRDVHDRLLLMVDDLLLRQIVGNLLSNACKYSGSNTTVTLRAATQKLNGKNWLRLTVQDEGIGVPPDDVPRLFETFHRASNAQNQSGTGLGLAIVKRAVEAHGGAIDVQSELGRGTAFEVRLPWNEAAADPDTVMLGLDDPRSGW
jgi:signal transduction histidine kinase